MGGELVDALPPVTYLSHRARTWLTASAHFKFEWALLSSLFEMSRVDSYCLWDIDNDGSIVSVSESLESFVTV